MSYEYPVASSSSPQPHATTITRPIIALPLHPSQSIGPFILGSTIYQTLSHLRTPSSQSLFPRLDIDFNAQDPRKAPLVIRPYTGIHCVFDNAAAGRLRCVVVDLDHNGAAAAQTDEDEAHRRDVKVEYHGKELRTGVSSASKSSNTVIHLNRGSIQQLFGPTYPARKHVTKQDGSFGAAATRTSSNSQTKWILSYTGLAFLFDESRSSADDLPKDAKPSSLVIYAGQDPLHPEEVQWPQLPAGVTSDQQEQSGSITGNHYGLVCTNAAIKPEVGVELQLLRPPYPPTLSSQLADHTVCLDLNLNSTTQQDVLLDLGYPERRWTPSDRGIIGPTEPQSEGVTVDFDSAASPEFWSYPSLGLDLLFASAHQAPLTKIVLHSDIPGSATWSRYEFVPWTLAGAQGTASNNVTTPPSTSGTAPTRAKKSKKTSTSKSAESSSGSGSASGSDVDAVITGIKQTAVTSSPSSMGAADINTSVSRPFSRLTQRSLRCAISPTSLSHSTQLSSIYTVLSSVTGSSSSDKELMTLDRSAEPEFKSLLQIDVRTQLRGWKGVVAEVLSLPVKSAASGDEVEKEDDDDSDQETGKGPDEEGVIVSWCIVSGAT